MTSALVMGDTGIPARRRRAAVFRVACAVLTWLCLVLLAVLLYHVASMGVNWVDLDFLRNPPSYKAERSGLYSALMGTVWIMGLTAVMAIPLGVGAAIYLEEYARKTTLNTIIEINIANLAGVPSIVYGLLGLGLFVHLLQLKASVLAGACTMSLLILPIIIIAAREAIRAVPPSLRHAALALGATRWQTLRHHVLPSAMPGIMTGVILALSRAIGETAPLVVIGAAAYVRNAPRGVMDDFSALPIQIYTWTTMPQPVFRELAAAGILVLLAVLLLMNSSAVYIRHRSQKDV